MELLPGTEYFRSEWQGLLDLAASIEKLLETACKNDYDERLKSLTELRSLDHGLAGIIEHCHAGNRIVDSTYYQNFCETERARVNAEHEQISQLVASFREELQFATADRTMAMILPGMDLVSRLRSHISFERELLRRILQHPKKEAEERKKTSTRPIEKKEKTHG